MKKFCILALSTLLWIGCGDGNTEPEPGEMPGAEEMLGRSCSEDADCGNTSVCEASVCSRPCSSVMDCRGIGDGKNLCAKAPSGTPRFVCRDREFVGLERCTDIKNVDAYCSEQFEGSMCCSFSGGAACAMSCE